MVKKVFLLALGLLIASEATAQEPLMRKRYANLSFSNTKMTQKDFPSLKSNYGAAFTVGKTFFVHKKPIAKIVRFGVDATWADINYTNYKIEYRYYSDWQEPESELLNAHQAEIGVQVGPSIVVNPVSKLNIHGYFRYAPSFSALYDSDLFRGGFANYFVGGGAISYEVIGLGAEARFGSCTYKTFGGEDSEKDDYNNSEGSTENLKGKFSGMRVYLTFRF